MKRILKAVLFVVVAMIFASCEEELVGGDPDRVITQGEIVGDWTWVCPEEEWAWGDISIDKYGNFKKLTKGFGPMGVPEECWVTATGKMTVAGGKVTIAYDGAESSKTYKIKQSAVYKNRWLVGPYEKKNDGRAYMAFGVECHGGMMKGGVIW